MSEHAAPNLPPLPQVDWKLLAQVKVVLVGAGAIGRPLMRGLGQLGMRKLMVVDPKRYRERSILSQCRPDEVGRLKAEVVAEEAVSLGMQALALPRDIEQVPPGYLEGALVIVSVDNRRAEILANRQAARMRCPVVKVNVEPLFLTASLRYYDLSRSLVDVCLECQMSAAHYAGQHHPLSCDGEDAGRPTASPRPLCELAANSAALVIGQIIGSPDKWSVVWRNRQWQTNLLGGQTQLSELPPKADCRWDHAAHWRNLTRLGPLSNEMTLGELILQAGMSAEEAQLQLSGQATTHVRCMQCGQTQRTLRWLRQLDDDLGPCTCGGNLRAVPYYCFDQVAAAHLAPWLDVPLAAWGVEPESIVVVGNYQNHTSFIVAE